MISIVIPFYNEEKRIKGSIPLAITYLSSNLSEPFELVFVNDGSLDGTQKILEEIKNENPSIQIKLLGYERNQGKGFAVKIGVLGSTGQKIIVMDADVSIDLSELPRFLLELETCDVVVGSKKHLLTQTLKKQKVPRRILGKGFTGLTNLLLGISFTDITCGFKGFRADVAKKLFGKQLMKKWSYDAETLFLAKQFKYRVVELPVKWRHVEGSKVSPLPDTIEALRDLALIILNFYLGRYIKISSTTTNGT